MAKVNSWPEHQQRGFTLLEILIALALTAGMSLMCWQVLHGVMLTSASIKQHSTRFTQLQFAFTLLERDFSQAIVPSAEHYRQADRPRATQALVASAEAHLLRHNWLNPGALLPRTELEEVAYRLHQGQLEGISFRYPPQSEEAPDDIMPLLTGVESFYIVYYQGGKKMDRWNMFSNLPDSVRITLRLAGIGEITRHIIVTHQ